MTTQLERLRTMDGSQIGFAVCFFGAALLPLAGLVTRVSPAVTLGVAVAFGLIALIARRQEPPLRHYLSATALMGVAMAATWIFSGHPLHSEMHLGLVLMLAVVSTARHTGALVLACGLGVAHSFASAGFAPGLPKGLSADLGPELSSALGAFPVAALHSAVLCAVGALLVILVGGKSDDLQKLEQGADRLKTESQMADDARQEAQDAKDEMQDVMDALRVGLTRLAGRDLSFGIRTPFPENYEILRTEFNETVEVLREAFINASQMTDDYASDAQKLSHSVTRLSRMTVGQAETLGNMNQTTSHLVSTLGETAATARDAAQTAGEARDSALRGSEVTEEAISAMRGIEDSSRQISQIVDLIDDVSFQTNLLALNAGVEAARAGESGKGFAVVASEVRQLAQSTSEAANGIKKLISDSSDQVTTGADLVDAVGQRLDEIKAQISRTSELTESISARNLEQSQSVTQLHSVVSNASGETQDAVALGKDLAAMTRRMTISSKKLSCDMEAFTLTEEDILKHTSAL